MSSKHDKFKNMLVKYLLDVDIIRNMLYKPLRFMFKVFLWLRSYLLTISGRKGVQNVYIGTVQKTGSMWLKTILSDPRIRKHTGLIVYPQHRYEYGEFKSVFPKYAFVPSLYVDYQLYEIIRKPEKYKTVYVIRDPRNIIVSWYHSMRYTHRLVNSKVRAYRKILEELDYDDGIRFCIEEFAIKFAFMRSWMYRVDSENVLVMKFEDMVSNPLGEMQRFMKHIDAEMPDAALEDVLASYTKEKMRERDLQRRMTKTTNYGKKVSNWREAISEENMKHFYAINGDLIELLGYER